MITNNLCGNCHNTGFDHRGRYCECNQAIRHIHAYSFENLGNDGYETHSCSCGSTIRFHVKE